MPSDTVQVCVRVRPLISREVQQDATYAWEWKDKVISRISDNKRNDISGNNKSEQDLAQYAFNHLYGPDVSTEKIYLGIAQTIITRAMEGYHGSIFAYGQTCSGKTYTMCNSKNGLVPLSIQHVFQYIQSMPAKKFLLRMAYIEIYNESIVDLLASQTALKTSKSKSRTSIRILTHPKKKNEIILEGVKEEIVVSADQVLAFVAVGDAHRHTGATELNDHSSRAHTILRLTIESCDGSSASPVRVSTLSLIDLAGSESVKLTQSTGVRKQEGGYINRSLLTLGHIISKLSQDGQSKSKSKSNTSSPQHLPYRDSKLTRILQPSLSGNAKVAMICNVSPALGNVSETLNTLKFASRAKHIQQRAVKMNQDPYERALIQHYEHEIETLKLQLHTAMMTPCQVQDIEELEFAIANIHRIILNSTSTATRWTDKDLDTKDLEKTPRLEKLHQEEDYRVGNNDNNGTTSEDHRQVDPCPATRLQNESSHLNLTKELEKVEGQLKNALARRRTFVSATGIPTTTNQEDSQHDDDATKDLELKYHAQTLGMTISEADRKFLERQLEDRTKMLEETVEYLETADARQVELEEMNQHLKDQNEQLRQILIYHNIDHAIPS